MCTGALVFSEPGRANQPPQSIASCGDAYREFDVGKLSVAVADLHET